MKDYVILLDGENNVIGLEDKVRAHVQKRRHSAFSVFLFNDMGHMLLQCRADGKYHSAGLWSNTCCSHPGINEECGQQAHERLKYEMGVDCSLKELVRQLKAGNGNMAQMADWMAGSEGKLIRPVLFYLVYLLFSDCLQRGMGRVAVGIEWIHSASLIHDDIMDNGLVRRGRKSFVSEYGLDDALVMGDFLIFAAMQELNSVQGKNAGAVRRQMIWNGLMLCGGQKEEKKLLGNIDAGQDVYFQVIEMKTACFFEAVFKAAAFTADQDMKTVENLGDAGKELGYAFQIRNDIKDIMSADGEHGSSDIQRHLVTLPVILAYRNGGRYVKAALKEHYALCKGRGSGEIKRILLETGGVREAEKIMKRSLRTAYDILTDYGRSDALDEISRIMDYLRDKI